MYKLALALCLLTGLLLALVGILAEAGMVFWAVIVFMAWFAIFVIMSSVLVIAECYESVIQKRRQ